MDRKTEREGKGEGEAGEEGEREGREIQREGREIQREGRERHEREG